eukprot:CAMPEP_0176447024 /NCGR_PEP_ID=MMETSP0127-20121128/24736_1 /TAXON_ID=938130 /ORGANISM="Platyophrya macrostoma, Strain WH" /LENGTH=461 /DNA_ID=CAMNT_0017833293 /DNA_START=228 /DNA_END=1610 /DNA_ORIENTATION=-
MMAISCVSSSSCYIAGGSNGGGFGVLSFNGQPNGNFSSLYMPDTDMMLLGIGVGGTEAAPVGAVGGFGVGDNVQYFVNATTLLPSSQPFFFMTQDIRASKDGKSILVVAQSPITASSMVLFSTNGGKNLTNYTINSLMPNNETEARYGAIADANTWYVALGNWPSGSSSGSSGASMRRKTPRSHVVRNAETGKWRMEHVGGPADGYTCVIAKTTDAGKTWHNVMYEDTTYYPNGIDCISPTHCVVVGEGFNERAGGHVWLTTDGLTFQQTLHLKDNSSGQFSLMSVQFNGEQEVWVGGSFATSQTSSVGVFYYSQDGGLTWTEHGTINFVAAISDISFTAEGVGFATALTIFDDSTILRFDPNGPPQTPSPTWQGDVTQIQCSDANCSVNCTSVKFAQNQCGGLNGGGSAIAQCQDGMLNQYVFPFSSNCTGLSEEQPTPCNTCIQASNGGSFENFCGPHA